MINEQGKEVWECRDEQLMFDYSYFKRLINYFFFFLKRFLYSHSCLKSQSKLFKVMHFS